MTAPVGRALAIHPGALGDVLLAVPALRALRTRGGGALAIAAQPRIGALLLALDVVDQGLSFDSLGLDRLFSDEAAAEPCAPLETAERVVCWFGARDPVFTRRLRELAPGAIVASPTGDGSRVWEHLLATVEALTGPAAADASGLCRAAGVSAEVRRRGREALRAAGWDGAAPLLVVHPGAGGLAKRWPVERFAAVIDAAADGVAVAVHEGPADAEPAAALIARLAPRPSRPVLHLDRPGLPSLAGALAQASLYLGNDSGVSHLAAAVGAPALILFTAAHLAWRPWSPLARTQLVDPGPGGARDVDAVAGAVGALVADGLAPR
jgi:ADP-heptose:LPS heptosyltransferase